MQATGLSEDKAGRMMAALRAGQTLRLFAVKLERLEAYFAAHPQYAQEARPLIEANAKAAHARKSPKLRIRTCIRGHDLDQGRIYYKDGYTCRRCLACERIRKPQAGVLKPGQIERATQAIKNGVTLNQICKGLPMGGGPRNSSLILIPAVVFYRYRLENPEFNRFVRSTIESRICLRDPIANVAPGTFRYEWNPADAKLIPAMVPDYFPGKSDVVQTIFVELIEGRLDRRELKAFIRWSISQYSRQHGKYARFGNSPLLSLDEALFDDSSGTRGDNVSRGLWD